MQATTPSRQEIFDEITLKEVKEGSRKYVESRPLPSEAQERIRAFKADRD